MLAVSIILFLLSFLNTASAQDCIECHSDVTPGIVDQWQHSTMSKDYSCDLCHGTAHTTEEDWQEAEMPRTDDCKKCHQEQYSQYASGKHYYAWIAMEAMPALQHIPSPQKELEGFKGCSGCHRIGVVEDSEEKYGAAACDSCHTRHNFSKGEAQEPEACLPCHQGFDHAQYEMWSTSKHGVIYRIEGDTGRAPKCQTCHMSDGNHSVMTSWGFLALRVPEDDQEWWEDRVTILKALGVLDENGDPTERYDVVEAGKVARLSKEEWQAEREKMVEQCSQCHAENFVTEQLQASDQMIKEADRVFAEEIRTVKELYDKGVLDKPEDWDYAPDLLQFYLVQSPIEQELYLSFMEYRMRTFQGAFHMNPDYSHWYGWAPLKASQAKIDYEAEKLIQESQEAQMKTPTPDQSTPEEESSPGFEMVAALVGISTAAILLRRRSN